MLRRSLGVLGVGLATAAAASSRTAAARLPGHASSAPTSLCGADAPLGSVSQEFELGKVLGEGNYAQVKLSKEKATGHMWAIKVINKKKLEVRVARSLVRHCISDSAESPTVLQPGDEEMLALEVEVLAQLSHPNIIHLYKCVSYGRFCHAPGRARYAPDFSQLTAVHAECSIPNIRCSWCWSL
jgi:serine/threonine protein kinase